MLDDNPVGTVRRAPTGFSHAIKLSQPDGYPCWQIIDLYGPWGLVSIEEVDTWLIVYTPDENWGIRNP